MWVLAFLVFLAAVAGFLAFVRGGSSSYWDHPQLLNHEGGDDETRSRRVA